ncbi:MAG: carbamate kinase [Salinisphaera sp.]|jgi:carbamate kinase|nr:carbamate kinase [Salinisphaera sp.]
MKIVVALGGNALLHRGEPLTAANQRANASVAAEALAQLVTAGHQLVVSHGNGPQVGLLALQGAAYKPGEVYPLDVLGAETEGMIGYLIEQELGNRLPCGAQVATLLTQVEVDRADPAFHTPSKPVGPVYCQAEAERLAVDRGWQVARDGDFYRRVVPSPSPQRILEFKVIQLLLEHGVIPICAGGGGIPVVVREDGHLEGVEAVIDKDATSALLAEHLRADALLMLTDVDAVQTGWNTPGARRIRSATADALDSLEFSAGSMGPKIEAAQGFVRAAGGFAAIGRLQDAGALLTATAGSRITASAGRPIEYYG